MPDKRVALPVDEDGTPRLDDAQTAHVLEVARQALVAAARGEPCSPDGEMPTLPLFVTLWTAAGDLRGCVGHVFARCASLEEEVAQCTLAAATSDPRFEPLQASEAPSLSLTVTLLGRLQTVSSPSELDPQRYGVLLEGPGGRRGVLLPQVAGVTSVETQLRVTRQKAGLRPGEETRLSRFTVCKLGKEPAG